MILRRIVTETVEGGASPPEHERRVYDFVFLEMHGRPILTLDYYAFERRPTKRHAWRLVQHYERLNQERSSYRGLPESEVEVPPGVWEQARAEFTATIRVGKWNDVR